MTATRSIKAKVHTVGKTSPERNDIVELSKDLWLEIIALRSPAAQDSQNQIISITFHNKAIDSHLIVNARQSSNDDNESAIYMPPKLAKASGISESTANAFVAPSSAVTLTEVILDSYSHDAYVYASSNKQMIIDELEKGSYILRTSQSLALPLPDKELTFKVMMTEPVLQGYLTTETDLIITFMDKNSVEEEQKEAEQPADYTSLGEADIDQDFMASSFLGEIKPSNGLHFSLDGDHEQTNGFVEGDAQLPEAPSITFTAAALDTALDLSEIHPKPSKRDDPEIFVYLHLADLAKLACFSGDWVQVSVPDSNRHRSCRVFALPESVPKKRGSLLLSPILLFNLLHGGTEHSLCIRRSQQQVQPSIAKTVTVARIASPVTVDRTYQAAFLAELKHHFETVERVVCDGDIIAIGLNEDVATLHPKRKEGDFDTLEEISLPLASTAPNLAAYFQIVKIEGGEASDESKASNYSMRVDTKKTKMMQSGLEHSQVPIVTSYLGIVTETPTLPIESSLTAHESPFARLVELLDASVNGPALELGLISSILVEGPRGSGKRTIVQWAADKLNLHLLEINCYDFVGETDVKTEGNLRARFEKAMSCAPCVLLLRHVDALARKSAALESGQEPAIANTLKDCIEQLHESLKTSGHPAMLVGTTGDVEKIPPSVVAQFKHELLIESPGETERHDILKALTKSIILAPDVSLKSLATQTAALVAKDLVDLVSRANITALERVTSTITDSSIPMDDIAKAGIALSGADFDVALGNARSSYSDSIGAPKIPNVTWDDVGGLASVKSDILDTIQLPLEHPELFASGMKKRSGILLYGPPGTGKTLLAKAVATSCSLNFFSVKGPELLNMYIGESEANVRRVFQRARDAKPCVIFFDELDSVAPKRGNQGDSGGVMDRIVSQLLAELDGMTEGKGSGDVFVIGATNRPDLLDAALLRPGRFDKMLYLGVSDNHDAQLNIIQALTRKFRLDPSLDLRRVAEICPFNYTGADFYALCSDAMLKAMTRKASEVESKVKEINANGGTMTVQTYLDQHATPEDISVQVNQQDFELALRELVPSVSEKELDHYKIVQARFKNETLNAIKSDDPPSGDQNGGSSNKGKAPLDHKGKGKARA